MGRGAPFPRDVAEFDTDDRISYSKLDGKYILIDDDNEEWEFSEATASWFQPVSPSTRPIALQYQSAMTEPSRMLCAEPIL